MSWERPEILDQLDARPTQGHLPPWGRHRRRAPRPASWAAAGRGRFKLDDDRRPLSSGSSLPPHDFGFSTSGLQTTRLLADAAFARRAHLVLFMSDTVIWCATAQASQGRDSRSTLLMALG